jgi:hypothetical protein
VGFLREIAPDILRRPESDYPVWARPVFWNGAAYTHAFVDFHHAPVKFAGVNTETGELVRHKLINYAGGVNFSKP